ncbi:MAG TPA: hypothetical protein VFD03_04375 [Clostridia bacterium]|nr:hypothetical protein [Clostridia bacterium]
MSDKFQLIVGGSTAFQAEKNVIYSKEVAIIKRYDDKYKLTLYNCLRANGWEDKKPNHDRIWENISKSPPGGGDHKMQNNISRARAKIFELSMCNEWEYFITMTLDKEKYKRDDLEKFQKDLTIFIRNFRRDKSPGLKYLFIPELHHDGINWHIHGLIKGLDEKYLSKFIKGIHPNKLVKSEFLNWQDYSDKFGFISLGIIENHEATAKYITKYISKDLDKSVKELSKHLYYCSQGLKGAEVIKKGTLLKVPDVWEFRNDYVSIIWIDASEVNSYVV